MRRFLQQVKRSIMILTLVVGLSTPLLSTTANAGIFDDAKGEACKGAELSDSAGPNCGNDDAKDLGTTMDKAINLISIIVGILAVIFIIISGFRFVTSNGDSNKITEARNAFIYALIGLIIVAFAQLIVKLIISRIL